MSPKEKENTVKAAIWLPEETHRELKKEAREKGLNVSALVRMIILEHYSKEKQE